MNNSSNITVIKIGGSTLGETDSTFADIASLHKKGWKVVLIHGGGKEISKWINIQGIEPNFVDGLRVTDKKTLDVAIAVLSGKVIVIYFPEGIMGWLREKYPERFGEVIDEADRKAQVELK